MMVDDKNARGPSFRRRQVTRTPRRNAAFMQIQKARKNKGGRDVATGSKTTTPSLPTTHGPPHNKEIVQIETQIKALHLSSGDTKDPKRGCFCLARDHPLSPHVPICQSCGLILCALNLPQYACPFCAVPILVQRERIALISGLEKRVEDIKEREDGAAKRTQDTHKVLSVRTKPGSKKSQVVISSYSPSPAGSRPVSRGPDVEAEEESEKQVQRVPQPDREPKYAKRVVDPNRPWENLLQTAKA
ncbi:hypothetical protein APHAL10511_008731 [Amanita phalloides]|nr:hypothetical protein APHAL10511_008731 [Amanita phalloides]